MGRPIDADVLMKAMYHRAFETDGDTMWQSGCWVRYRAIEQVVKEQPTVTLESEWEDPEKHLPPEGKEVLIMAKTKGEFGEREAPLYAYFKKDQGWMVTIGLFRNEFEVIAWKYSDRPKLKQEL